jgi:hypothetical protein
MQWSESSGTEDFELPSTGLLLVAWFFAFVLWDECCCPCLEYPDRGRTRTGKVDPFSPRRGLQRQPVTVQDGLRLFKRLQQQVHKRLLTNRRPSKRSLLRLGR